MFSWFNPPSTWSNPQSDDLSNFKVNVDGKTDFWRITRHKFIKDDAHFYYKEIQGNFSSTVKITGDYKSLYDQAGLMVRQDANHWMKCGIEFLDGIQQASAVITRDYSDWSIIPLNDNPKSIWIRVDRIGEAIEVYYSRNGSDFIMMRQGYLSKCDKLQVGLMCAAPTGDGFTVYFENFTIKEG